MSYVRLRTQEEAYLLFNYFDPIKNLKYRDFIAKSKACKIKAAISIKERNYGIQKIHHLYKCKGYRIETLFMAANIFDRYLLLKGHWNLNISWICHLATVSMILAAKMRQPM